MEEGLYQEMKKVSFLGKIKAGMMKIFSRQDPRFRVDINEQLDFLNSLPDAKDNFERSYNQYQCQKKVSGKGLYLLLNTASFFFLPIYAVKLAFSKVDDEISGINAVAFLNDIQHDIIPESLQKEAGEISFLRTEEHYFLDQEDRRFIGSVWKKYPISFYFLFKIMMKISMYSYAVHMYHPKMIIAYVEYSFTSSVLTEYCRYKGIEHVNVLHGEKPLYIRDSFVCFDRFYVWDIFYEKQFLKLKASPNQFRIELPPAFKFSTIEKPEVKYDFIYYLGNESKDALMNICANLNELSHKGYAVAIRPHPRYSDLNLINSICKDIYIENTSEISIQRSILSTRNAVALFSTVLNQSHYNGTGVVIDNISDPVRFEVLKSLNYIGFAYKHTLLSDWIKK